MGDFSARRRTAQSGGPQSVPPTTPEKTTGREPTIQDEILAKKEAQSTDAERDKLNENGREPKQTTSEVSITSAAQGLMNKRTSTASVWRVGRRGLIQKLESDGKWKKQKSGVKADLYSSAFAAPDVGWAVGQAGTVLRTTDGGETWSQVSKPTDGDLVQVTATSDQAASVSTRSGETFKTIDGGNTWTASAQ
jgi:hypothetical protein